MAVRQVKEILRDLYGRRSAPIDQNWLETDAKNFDFHVNRELIRKAATAGFNRGWRSR